VLSLQRRFHRRDNGTPAVQMQFGKIFSCGTTGSGEYQSERAVQRLTEIVAKGKQ
jgi:hypothetical protein